MQQLTCLGPNRLTWQEVPDARLEGPGEALVRPVAVASCDLDAALVGGQTPFQAPVALGHECVARVVAIGDAVRTVAPGDLVVVAFQVSCGTCAWCVRGLTANCSSVPRTSMYGVGAAGGGWGGALSDLLRVPFADHMLLPVPAGLDPCAVASASDNIADGWRAIAPVLAQRPGDSALMLCGDGPGSIPLYAVQIAVALGAGSIDVVTTSERITMQASALGASARHLPAWPRRLGNYGVTVDATWSADGLACALRSTAPGGVCTSTSIYFSDSVSLPLLEMYSKGVTFVTGRVQSRAVLPEVLALIASGGIAPERVITERVPWQDAAEALLSYTTKLVVYRE